MQLNEMAKKVHQNAVDHGWWEPEFTRAEADLVIEAIDGYFDEEFKNRLFIRMLETRSFGEIAALCHAEISEAVEEFRDHRSPREIYYRDAVLGHEIHPIDLEERAERKPHEKPEGIPIELADVIIRILDYCGSEEIDIENAVRIKHEYNKTRPYKHGGKKL